MRPFRGPTLMTIVCVALTSPAVAGATEIAIEAKFDRNPSNFDIPKDTKIRIDGAHTFVNGVILGTPLNRLSKWAVEKSLMTSKQRSATNGS